MSGLTTGNNVIASEAKNLSSAETQERFLAPQTPFGMTKRNAFVRSVTPFPPPKKSENSFAFTEFGRGDVVDSRRYVLPAMQDGIFRRNEELQPVWC
jgi:hypothetical protein